MNIKANYNKNKLEEFLQSHSKSHFMQSFEFRLDDIVSETEKIHIITDVEFDKAFNEMINNMRYNHLKEML